MTKIDFINLQITEGTFVLSEWDCNLKTSVLIWSRIVEALLSGAKNSVVVENLMHLYFIENYSEPFQISRGKSTTIEQFICRSLQILQIEPTQDQFNRYIIEPLVSILGL